MKEIVFSKQSEKSIEKTLTSWDSWGMGLLLWDKESKEFYLPREIETCRGYIGELVYYAKQYKRAEKIGNLTGTRIHKDLLYNRVITKTDPVEVISNCLQKDLYYLVYLKGGDKINPDWIKSLHKKEILSRTKLSQITLTKYPGIYLVKSSGVWKDSAWKIMLHSFYVKMAFRDPDNIRHFDRGYWDALSPVENILLSKVRNHPDHEIFDPKYFGIQGEYGMHSLEGFVSICAKRNYTMYQRLIEKDIKKANPPIEKDA